jgi:predicted nucleic acid-binding protein
LSKLVLVDTSAWTQALRRDGDAKVRARVQQLLSEETAAWCEGVRLELWNGVRGEQERIKLGRMDTTIPRLPTTGAVWQLACETALLARTSGLTVPAVDLLVFACAEVHQTRIEHADKHFDLLAQLRHKPT